MAKISIPELLAPAGSLNALKAAVNAGADAVYISGKKFGARKFASNFTKEEMVEILIVCRPSPPVPTISINGVPVVVTFEALPRIDSANPAIS